MSANNTLQSSWLKAWETLIWWGLAFLWMLLIFFLSSQSDLGGMAWPPILMALRKSGHIIEYAVLGLLFGKALISTWRARNGYETPTRTLLMRVWWIGVALSALYAISDEYHQSFVPQRGAHFADILIDTLSAIAGLGIWYIVRTSVKRET